MTDPFMKAARTDKEIRALFVEEVVTEMIKGIKEEAVSTRATLARLKNVADKSEIEVMTKMLRVAEDFVRHLEAFK